MIQLTKQDIGKKFRTREGEVVEMLGWDDSTSPDVLFPALMSNEYSYTHNGNYWLSGKENPHDIIARVEEEPQPEKRIVITVMEKGIDTQVEGMSVLEAFGALNHVVRTFIEDKP